MKDKTYAIMALIIILAIVAFISFMEIKQDSKLNETTIKSSLITEKTCELEETRNIIVRKCLDPYRLEESYCLGRQPITTIRYCKCLDNMCIQPLYCSDGTPYNSCSRTKPLFCSYNGILINNCGLCGCSEGYCNNISGACIQLQCKNTADTPPLGNCNNLIEKSELLNFAKLWLNGKAVKSELISVANFWITKT